MATFISAITWSTARSIDFSLKGFFRICPRVIVHALEGLGMVAEFLLHVSLRVGPHLLVFVEIAHRFAEHRGLVHDRAALLIGREFLGRELLAQVAREPVGEFLEGGHGSRPGGPEQLGRELGDGDSFYSGPRRCRGWR